MKSTVFFWSVVMALGGFLFGFDTAVISGAEEAIQQVWHLGAYEHGFTISIALIGTVLGAILGGLPSDALVRRTNYPELDCGALPGIGAGGGLGPVSGVPVLPTGCWRRPSPSFSLPSPKSWAAATRSPFSAA